MSTQPFTGADYSTYSQWVAAFKPHYSLSDIGFNPGPDTDWSTGPNQDIRSRNRRDLVFKFRRRDKRQPILSELISITHVSKNMCNSLKQASFLQHLEQNLCNCLQIQPKDS